MKRTEKTTGSVMGEHVALRITQNAFERLKPHLSQDPGIEQYALGLFSKARTADGTVMIIQDILLPDRGDLQKQGPAVVVPTRAFRATGYFLAEQRGLSVLDIHTHTHSGQPRFSGIDEARSAEDASWVCRRYQPPVTMAMLLFGNDLVAHDAVIYDRALNAFRTIDTLEVLGRRIEIRNTGAPGGTGVVSALYDRQIRVPGWDQETLARLKVGVLGLGGNGAHVLQTLVGMGVGTDGWIAGVDSDFTEASNVPRIPYAHPTQIGQAKATVAAQFVGLKNPSVRFLPYPCPVTEKTVVDRLKGAHILIGAGDNDGLRKTANEIAVRFSIPFIDLGCDIQVENKSVTAGGQVRVVLPGTNACLVCCGGYDPAAAAEELADDERKLVRAARGYVRGMQAEAAPSVANLNATIAQLGIAALLALVHGERFGKWDFAHFNQFTAETVAASTQRNLDCPLCGRYGCVGAGDETSQGKAPCTASFKLEKAS